MAELNLQTFFKLSYGLFVVASKNGEKDGACISNTVIQVTIEPNRILVALNKSNFTHDLIMESKKLCVSILSEQAPFSVFQQFGFKTGHNTDKFEGFDKIERCENGVYRLSDYANAYIAGDVTSTLDLGTHTAFVVDVTEAVTLSDVPSVTYDYYFKNIKPQPQAQPKKKGFVCKICGYVYEGEVLPPDFICPVCKHGASDFEPIV